METELKSKIANQDSKIKISDWPNAWNRNRIRNKRSIKKWLMNYPYVLMRLSIVSAKNSNPSSINSIRLTGGIGLARVQSINGCLNYLFFTEKCFLPEKYNGNSDKNGSVSDIEYRPKRHVISSKYREPICDSSFP